MCSSATRATASPTASSRRSTSWPPRRIDMPVADVAEELIATSEEGLREQALRTLKKRRDFHTHAFAYLTINILVWGVWLTIALTSGSWFPWPLWVTLGWGV